MSIDDRLPVSFSESPEDPKANLILYWNGIRIEDAAEGISGDLVHDYEVKVSELLSIGTPQAIEAACRVTARFEFLRRSSS